MRKCFKVGDHVSWNSEAGRVRGRIKKVHTKDLNYKGYVHHASKDDPQYEIKSDKTDHVALHKASALRREWAEIRQLWHGTPIFHHRPFDPFDPGIRGAAARRPRFSWWPMCAGSRARAPTRNTISRCCRPACRTFGIGYEHIAALGGLRGHHGDVPPAHQCIVGKPELPQLRGLRAERGVSRAGSTRLREWRTESAARSCAPRRCGGAAIAGSSPTI